MSDERYFFRTKWVDWDDAYALFPNPKAQIESRPYALTAGLAYLAARRGGKTTLVSEFLRRVTFGTMEVSSFYLLRMKYDPHWMRVSRQIRAQFTASTTPAAQSTIP